MDLSSCTMKPVICTRNLWFGPTMSMGQRITNEINCDPEEVAILRERLRKSRESEFYWTLDGKKHKRRPGMMTGPSMM